LVLTKTQPTEKNQTLLTKTRYPAAKQPTVLTKTQRLARFTKGDPVAQENPKTARVLTKTGRTGNAGWC